MSILLLLFLIIVGGLLYLFWPLIRLFLAFRNSSRSARSAFEQAQRQSGARGGQTQKQPKRPHKIIDPSVGEYVEFEEIKTFTQTDTTTTEETTSSFTYRREEQIEDAEWEDIK